MMIMLSRTHCISFQHSKELTEIITSVDGGVNLYTYTQYIVEYELPLEHIKKLEQNFEST